MTFFCFLKILTVIVAVLQRKYAHLGELPILPIDGQFLSDQTIPPKKVSLFNHLLESYKFRFRSIQIQVYCLKYRRNKFLVQQNFYINKK